MSDVNAWRYATGVDQFTANIDDAQPILTVVGIGFGLALSGALVIEQVYSLPGVGRLVIGAVLRRDWPVIQGGLLLTTFIFVLVNLAVDLLYLWVDPRLRESS